MPKNKSLPEVRITVANFDSSGAEVYRVKRNGVTVKEWTPFTSADYIPNGGTPLLDATARFVADLEGQRGPDKVIVGLLCDESGSMNGNRQSVVDGVNEFVGSISGVDGVDPEAAGKVIAVILTDGYENMSREVTKEQIADLISSKEADGWTLIYMGANQDAWGESAGLGFSSTSSGTSINYTSSPRGTSSALRAAGKRTSTYLSSNATYDGAYNGTLASSTVAEDGTTFDSTGAISAANTLLENK
jgi:hypothetical protein